MASAAYTPLTGASESPSMPPKPSGSGLTPGIVYRPLSPTDLQSLDGNDEDVRGKWKFNVSLIPALRAIIAILTLSNIIFWIIRGVYGGEASLVFLCVWMFFILFWNSGILAGKLLASIRKRKTTIRTLPIIVCQIGDWGFVWNGDEENGVDKVSRRRRKEIPLAWICDIPFGVITIVIAAVGFERSRWWYTDSRLPAYALSLTIGSLETIVAAFSLFSFYGTVVLEAGVLIKKPTSPYQQIHLPDDRGDDDRRTAGISISA
ncbi:hypothetical protein QBC38DRAFT_415 [Podospora fimiseda]|uniref:Uncharacterized protein n=1 Tax=Podospora fimiseda TaxID=252190 RepID=A0AAN7H617_9PEZI|nr:hypothetical protein QBC38DRAFT_415 [Podospora fimiseda]